MAVETVSQFFKDTAEDDEITWPFKMDRQKKYEENRLVTAIKYANLCIYEAALANAKKKGMGTTIVAVNFTKDGVYIAHVGDSRIYRFRNGELKQMTEDHSLLNDYIKMGVLSEEEIKNFPHKNVIVRALGMKDNVQVDISFEVPQDKDIYLLCSDGLSGEVPDDQMQDLLRQQVQPGLLRAGSVAVRDRLVGEMVPVDLAQPGHQRAAAHRADAAAALALLLLPYLRDMDGLPAPDPVCQRDVHSSPRIRFSPFILL